MEISENKESGFEMQYVSDKMLLTCLQLKNKTKGYINPVGWV